MSQQPQLSIACPICRRPFYFKYFRSVATKSLAAHTAKVHPDVDRVKEQQR